ncbi:ASKHA domain-containing protein [Desulfonatronum parangueonense]
MDEPVRFVDSRGEVRLVRADPRQTLAHVLFLEGLWPTRPFCAGLGRCGHCVVYFDHAPPEPLPAETAALSSIALSRGGRLACRRVAEPGLRIALPFSFPASIIETEKIPLSRPILGSLSLAVDLGTTSIHWLAGDQTGDLAGGRELNPQLVAGSEVMSRLAFALTDPGNAGVLRDIVLRRLQALVRAFPEPVERACIAGNTVMTALLLDWPLAGLASAPYRLPHAGGMWTTISLPGDSDLQTYIPPLPAPFIGADVSAGLAALHFDQASPPAYPWLFADLGTNGEFILALGPEQYLAASVPMGPALEGIGMARGSAALPGVWVDVTLTARGLQPRVLTEPAPVAGSAAVIQPKPEQAEPMAGQRISGTGYLSLLAALRRLGLVDETGAFVAGQNPLARRVGLELRQDQGETRFMLGPDVYLTGRDVEEVLKVKAAFNLAFSRLLKAGGVVPDALRAVYLAGALGDHIDLSALEELGFVPLGSRQRIKPLGNTSLAGARLLANDQRVRDWIEQIVPRITTLNIGQENNFFTNYIQRLVFRYV